MPFSFELYPFFVTFLFTPVRNWCDHTVVVILIKSALGQVSRLKLKIKIVKIRLKYKRLEDRNRVRLHQTSQRILSHVNENS